MSKTISASIPDNLAMIFEIFVKKTDKSESFHIQKALESYLEDYADLNIALERLRDVSDPLLSLDDMRKKLGI